MPHINPVFAVEPRHLICLGETPAVQVWQDVVAQWLYVRWRGCYNFQAAGEGWDFLLQCLQQHPCAKMLNDVRDAATGWAGKETWAGESLFPLLSQAGVQYMACVYPTVLPARFSLDATLTTVPHPFVAAFEDVATAYSWLQQQPAGSVNNKPLSG